MRLVINKNSGGDSKKDYTFRFPWIDTLVILLAEFMDSDWMILAGVQ